MKKLILGIVLFISGGLMAQKGEYYQQSVNFKMDIDVDA